MLLQWVTYDDDTEVPMLQFITLFYYLTRFNFNESSN